MKERNREARGTGMKVKKQKKTFPLYPYLLQGQQALPSCKPVSVGRPSDIRYTRLSHHPTTPMLLEDQSDLGPHCLQKMT